VAVDRDGLARHHLARRRSQKHAHVGNLACLDEALDRLTARTSSDVMPRIAASAAITRVIRSPSTEPDAIPAMSGNGNAAMTMMPAVPERAATENLQALGVAGLSTQLWLAPPG
jgi:hypothetical protein